LTQVVYPVPIKCQLPNIITPINKVRVGITWWFWNRKYMYWNL